MLVDAFGLRRINVPAILPRMFKSTVRQFFIYSLVQTPLLLHQDGDRGFEFKEGSSFFRKARRIFDELPVVTLAIAPVFKCSVAGAGDVLVLAVRVIYFLLFY